MARRYPLLRHWRARMPNGQPPPRVIVVKQESSSQHDSRKEGNRDESANSGWKETFFKVVEGSATAFGSIAVLGLAGYSYHTYYKYLVLQKMENAFSAGFSTPELIALARHAVPSKLQLEAALHENELGHHEWIPRTEQPLVDAILDGSLQGRYHLITGERGSGKTSMILKAMRRVHGDGIAMLEAHGDPEIFRLRLGKALDYEFHEDYVGSLFNFKGPRDSTATLDIERAFNKMEKVALTRRARTGKPLILVINRVHLLREDDHGRNLLELIQQRAELWAASRLVTVVLTSDDHSITERLRWQATRLSVADIHDIPRGPALASLKDFRAKVFKEAVPQKILDHVYNKIGGRVGFLDHVARSEDMLHACDLICEREKRWLLGQCWILGGDIDDNAEDQQDFSAAAMVLAKALVEKEKNMVREGITDGRLPEIPLHEVRQIMTRPDLIQRHDHVNIFSIDSNSIVRADSVPMQNAFREICAQEGFEEHLQATLDRLDELESLGRTREIKMKDIVNDGEFQTLVRSARGNGEPLMVTVKATSAEKGGE